VFGIVSNLALDHPLQEEVLLNTKQKQTENELVNVSEKRPKPKYEPPQIKVLTEQEVLSAFQVTAAGSSMWWT
jgi:hypothetical protein